MRWLLVASFLSVAGFAQDPPRGPRGALGKALTDTADEVLRALAAKDDATLRKLGERPKPDPWLVADELCARGEFAAAAAYAAVTPARQIGDVAAYVAGRASVEEDPAARSALRKCYAGGWADEEIAAALVSFPVRDDVLAAMLQYQLAQALLNLHRYEEAARVLSTVATVTERIGWLNLRANTLRRWADAVFSAGRPEEALDLLWAAVRLEERRGRPSGAGGALIEIGSVNRVLGRLPAAIEALERARLLKAGDAVTEARIVGNLGNIHVDLGDYPRALELYRESLRRKQEAGDAAAIPNTLDSIGNVCALLGDFDAALAYKRDALEKARARDDKPTVGRILDNLANVHRSLGENARALALHEEALAIARQLKDLRMTASCLNNIANVCASLGDFDRAVARREEALALWRKGGDKLGEATTLGNLGTDHFGRGNLGQAIAVAEEALALSRALGDKAGIGRAVANLGRYRMAQGEFDVALPLLREAHALKKEMGDRPGAALVLVNVAALHRDRGDGREALMTFEQALAEAELLGATEVAVNALNGLAATRLETGDAAAALKSARRAVDESAVLSLGLGEAQGASARSQYAAIYATGAAAARALGDTEALAFFLERGRAGMLLEALRGQEGLWNWSLPEGLRALEARVQADRRVALWHYRQALQDGNVDQVRLRRQELSRADAATLDVADKIQREAKATLSVLASGAASLDAIRASLGDEDALVLYGLLQREAVALVVTRTGARPVGLGDVRPIEEACLLPGAWAKDGGDGAVADPAVAITRLRELLVAPLGLDGTVQRVLVSPEGALVQVPFAALLPERAVAFVPSGTTYGVLTARGRGVRGDGVLALGDPDYGTEPDSSRGTAVERGVAAPLPASRAEAMAVGDVRLLGAEATPAGFADALRKRPRWRAIHIACHGLVDPERPLLSSLALTGGHLAVMDVLRTRMPADLAVLSACETAKGRVYRAEGVVGFTRAFMYAGAARVLVSLWKVDDEATRTLMVKFYELWNPKDPAKAAPAATALKRAQEFVASHERWRHPYYWAAWQLWGLPD